MEHQILNIDSHSDGESYGELLTGSQLLRIKSTYESIKSRKTRIWEYQQRMRNMFHIASSHQ